MTSAEEFRSELGLTSTVANWLLRTGHVDVAATRAFLDPKLGELTLPDQMVDRDVAARRIARAIRRGDRIVVFGDYDCDGITSTAIMTEVLRELSSTMNTSARVSPLLASRFDGGYGVSAPATDRILRQEPNLVITCDCGSSDHASLKRIRDAGVDVIVIDHHLVPDDPLPALAFLNPHRPECGFAYKGLASCGLALSIAAALRKELGVRLDVRKWLDLVAIGTIADVAPMDGDNRILVRAGLLALRTSGRPGVKALLTLAKVKPEAPLTSRDVGFRLAPHINAPGRMGAPDIALQLLLATTEEAANAVAQSLAEISVERRAQQEQMAADAIEEIEREGYAQDPAIVVGRAGWNPGVVGIVAGRLSDRYGCPVAVVGWTGDDTLAGRGSVRGPAGSRLHDALSAVSDVLERFGGHQAAAGLEVQRSRLAELRRRFAEAVQSLPASGAVDDHGVLVVEPGDDPAAVLADLDRVEPCGPTNQRPLQQIEGRVLEAREVSGGHLKLSVELGTARPLSCFAVSQGALAKKLRAGVRVVGDLRHNTFGGVTKAEMFVERLEALPLR